MRKSKLMHGKPGGLRLAGWLAGAALVQSGGCIFDAEVFVEQSLTSFGNAFATSAFSSVLGELLNVEVFSSFGF